MILIQLQILAIHYTRFKSNVGFEQRPMPVNNCTCQKLILKVKERLKSELETEAEEEVVRIKNVSNMHAKAITRKVLSL